LKEKFESQAFDWKIEASFRICRWLL